MKLTGSSSPQDAARLLSVTTRAVAACLMPADRERWARQLPAELHNPMSATAYLPTQRAADVYAAVTQSEALSALSGIEQAQAAIMVLASVLPDVDAELIARHLPTELGKLLQARGPDATAPQPRAAPSALKPRHAGHISAGAFGSTHPVSEAEPGVPQPGSVGAWEDARTEHTLGSGRPDDDNTLATGQPGSKRNLGDAQE